MLSVGEAQDLVLKHVLPRQPAAVALGSAALGLVLAEDVVSDLDLPPHNKAMMDGYAVRVADLVEGRGTLQVVEEIRAGQVPTRALGPGQAARIMTGAPVPDGAEAVVMRERTHSSSATSVTIDDPEVRPGRHVLPRGGEMRKGETILRAGSVLRPPAIGLLAALGRTTAMLVQAPEVAILSTGDELVDAACVPGPGQIRNSNGPMLAAQVCRAGGRATYLGIAPDRKEALAALVAQGLRADLLVLSGGVSAGNVDFVPEVLQSLGVEPHFHKVAMKPGKPVFFGTRVAEKGSDPVAGTALGVLRTTGSDPFSATRVVGRIFNPSTPTPVGQVANLPNPRDLDGTIRNAAVASIHAGARQVGNLPHAVPVFGLPGNPVSSLVCFELFVRPAIRRLAGHAETLPRTVEAGLTEDFSHASDRPTYYPALLEEAGAGRTVRPLPWVGSSDLRALAGANGLLVLPAGDLHYAAGQRLPVVITDY